MVVESPYDMLFLIVRNWNPHLDKHLEKAIDGEMISVGGSTGGCLKNPKHDTLVLED